MAGGEKRERKEGREKGRKKEREGGEEAWRKEENAKKKKEEREGTNPWTGKTRVYLPGVLGLLAGFVGPIGRSAGLLFSRV